MDCTIEPIAEHHIAGFRDALDVVARERKYLAFLEAPPLESTAEFVRNNIKNDYVQFVAVSDGKVVGWCDIMPRNSRPVMAHVGVLGIGLLPAFRGCGIGRRLMTAALDKARAKNLTRIELGVREGNDNAMALYKKTGFQVEGLQKKAFRIDGVYENVYQMALLF